MAFKMNKCAARQTVSDIKDIYGKDKVIYVCSMQSDILWTLPFVGGSLFVVSTNVALLVMFIKRVHAIIKTGDPFFFVSSFLSAYAL